MWPYTPDEADWLALRTDPDRTPAAPAPTKTPLAAPAETQDSPDDDSFIAA